MTRTELEARPAPSAARRPRVLGVEDEDDYRLLLAEWLESEFEPVLLPDAERLFAEARVRRPDVILLDLGLPGIDGLRLCWSVREAPETAGVPVAVLTGFRDEALFHRVMEAGAASYLCKPIDGQALRRRLRRLLPDGGNPGSA